MLFERVGHHLYDLKEFNPRNMLQVRIPITTPKPKPTTKGPLSTSTDAVRLDQANHLGRGMLTTTPREL